MKDLESEIEAPPGFEGLDRYSCAGLGRPVGREVEAKESAGFSSSLVAVRPAGCHQGAPRDHDVDLKK